MTIQEQMLEEIGRILGKMCTLEPDSEEYTNMRKNLNELMDAFHKDLEVTNSDLAFERKWKLDQARQALDEEKMKGDLKRAKMEAIIGLLKTILLIGGTLASIVLTGFLEESTILSSKCLSWIKAIIPRG